MEQVKNVTDVISVGTVTATVFGWLPEISALFALIYTLIRIYESKTVQDLIAKIKKK
jgi:hypothetical protein